MSELTPIQKLEDAIHTYLDECEDDGALTAWVLAWQTSRINADPDLIPLSFASNFTMGIATSPETAIGLARITNMRLESRLTTWADDEDD